MLGILTLRRRVVDRIGPQPPPRVQMGHVQSAGSVRGCRPLKHMVALTGQTASNVRRAMIATATNSRPERMTQEARRAASDTRLIAAGIRLIAAQGTAGTSLAQVGQEAGYSRGLPGERFGTKLSFLDAVLQHIGLWFHRRLAERLQGRRGWAEVRARIAQHLDGAVGSTEATRALYHLYADAGGATPGLRPRIVALSRSFHAGFVDAIRDAQAMGEVDAHVEPDRQAALIFAAVRGVAVQFLADGDKRRLRMAERDVVALFEHVLCKEIA
jgi:AcrR family transcriptional regulator